MNNFLAEVAPQMGDLGLLQIALKEGPVWALVFWGMFRAFPQLIELARWAHGEMLKATERSDVRYAALFGEVRADRKEDRDLRHAMVQPLTEHSLRLQHLADAIEGQSSQLDALAREVRQISVVEASEARSGN